MNAQLSGPQEQEPPHPRAIGMLARSGFITLLARIWHGIGWIWSTVIVGGFLVGLLISSLTSANGLPQPDPRTWFITRQLLAHALVTTTVLIVAALLTLACYLADRHEQRTRHEQHRAQQEALVDIGRGVRKLLEGAQTQPVPRPGSPVGMVSTHADLSPPPPLWTLPYRHNPFFTGRERLLTLVHDRLAATGAAALTQALAISGLGGIGKTQIAIEYACRARDEYQFVFWVRAASRETLVADFVALAHLLKLPERDLEDQQVIVAGVKRWMEAHPNWLLILDNADELTLIPDFLPYGARGHLLLTTRAQATGSMASSIVVEQMEQDEGALLLLRRAKRVATQDALDQATPEERALAAAIVAELDGLPLALDQAGAYIEETGCGLGDYLQLYRIHRRELLQRRSSAPAEHPDPVATTWRLSFLQVEQANAAAADLLRLCAFLAPDAIPEMIITEGAQVLGEALGPVAGDAFGLNEAIEVLRRYSLVRRSSEAKMLTVHRLVQVVLQDAMPVEMRKRWKEQAVHAVNATFPGLEPSHWAACERWLPHAFICADWIKQEQMLVSVASRLLTQAGLYLKERAQYIQAESFLQQVLMIDEQVCGPEHLEVATDLNNLACLYWNQGRYAETEPLFQRALAIRQHHLGHEDLDTAETLQNLACLYQTQGKDEEAKQLFQAAVTIDEHLVSPTVAIDLSNQADLCRRLGRYEEAESRLSRALALHVQHISQDHLTIAHLLHKQGLLAYEQRKLEEASFCFKRTLALYEQWLGDDHPNTAQILNALADLARIQGHYEEAEPLFLRALAIKEKQFGKTHSSTAASLNSLALLYLQQGKWVYVKQGKYLKEGKFQEAESLLERALTIRKHVLGDDHPNTALLLNNLACLYQAQDKYEEAEQLFLRALAVHEDRLGREHPSTIEILHNLIYLYGIQGKYEEGQPLVKQALAIDKELSEHTYPKALFLQRENVTLLEAVEGHAESTT